MSKEIEKIANVKKKKSVKHIHFAVVENTGDLVSVESVPSGLLAGAFVQLMVNRWKREREKSADIIFAGVFNRCKKTLTNIKIDL